MEDILDIYEMPYDPAVPVVCMDEKPYQLLGEAREPLPMCPGDTQKNDSEYIRNGICSIFVFVEALGGVRHVSVREHRTATDWAEEIRYLVDVSYPDRDRILFVMDNLNYPCPFLPVQDISGSGSPKDCQKAGAPLHPQAWELAEHCRNRA
ncbi:MAG: hypothetical protein HFG65_15370 [Hungatella sp.]|nr:hypothetical protein [Hungatella sp.]